MGGRMSVMKDLIKEKYEFKSIGRSLEKSNIDEAIAFYKELTKNEYFINDYYPYRRLVMLFGKKKEFINQCNIIKEFFNSKIYCNNHQMLWFRNKLRRLSERGYCDEKDIDYCLELYENYSINNKFKSNIPVPIADRIRKKYGEIIIISEEKYDKREKTYELEEEAGELKRQNRVADSAKLYEYMIYDLGFNSYRYYQKLCVAYNDLGDYENELRIINEYFKGNSTKTKYSDDWFTNRLNKRLSNNKYPKSKNNKNLKFNQLNKYYKEVNSFIENDYWNRNDELEFLDEFSIDDLLTKYMIYDDYFEYDRSFSQKENIERKIVLKLIGNSLNKKNTINEAIDFYKNMLINGYFANDWYPYRQLCIIYQKLKRYDDVIDIIKKFFLSGIYCNYYQYNWFNHKLNISSLFTEIDENEVKKCLYVYEKNGSKNKDKLNNPVILADRFTKKDGKIFVRPLNQFNSFQLEYGLDERIRIFNEEENFIGVIKVCNDYFNEYYKFIPEIYDDYFRKKLEDAQSKINIG